MVVQRARKGNEEFEFIQFTGDNQEEIYEWSNGACYNMLDMDSKDLFDFKFVADTVEGAIIINKETYIVKGSKGVFYFAEPNTFYEIYEVIDNDTES